MTEKIKILAVDDDGAALFALESLLTESGFSVVTAEDGRQAIEKAELHNPDLVIMDVNMPHKTGFEVAATLRKDAQLKYCPILLLTSRDDLEDIVYGLNQGANDYLKKPYRREELLARVQAALRTRQLYNQLWQADTEREHLKSRLQQNMAYANIIGQSAAMQSVFELIEQVKDSDVAVLITGESGTGKELVAQALHYQSVKKDKPFVVQNCAALQDQLLESELFGHVKGAFTGAIKNKPGLFEVANGGSFFLDELGEMTQALQVKLLRVLQDGSFTPVGGTESRKVKVRIIAATNRDLEQMLKDGSFREDLYYRLNVVRIKLPPLRARAEDLPLLINHLLAYYSKRHGRGVKTLNPNALQLLQQYSWPGNIRELQNEIERMVILSGQEQVINEAKLSSHIIGEDAVTQNSLSTDANGLDMNTAIESLERQMIAKALEQCSGNKSEAARLLGISRSNLISKAQQYGLG